jgi:hypothetical protein
LDGWLGHRRPGSIILGGIAQLQVIAEIALVALTYGMREYIAMLAGAANLGLIHRPLVSTTSESSYAHSRFG